jgi:poly(3-hydroxybutyrate) depolymerase
MFGYRSQSIAQIRKRCPGILLVQRRIHGLLRNFLVYVPSKVRRTIQGRIVIFLGLDSWSPDERHGLPLANRVIEDICEECGVVGVFPFPYPQCLGFWWGWNTPEGALRWTPGFDDTDFIEELNGYLNREFGSIQVLAAGFGAGATFAQLLDVRLAGLLFGVASINGTIDPTSMPLPRQGARILVIHGKKNPLLPFEGGVGPTFKKRLHAWLLAGRRAQLSRPGDQVIRYATANGVVDHLQSPKDLQKPGYEFTCYGPPTSSPAIQYLVDGGHMWFGRNVGGEFESMLSRGNIGDATPEFSVNQAIVSTFGFDQLC